MSNDLKCRIDNQPATLVCVEPGCNLNLFCSNCCFEHAQSHTTTYTNLPILNINKADAIKAHMDLNKPNPAVPALNLWAKYQEFYKFLTDFTGKLDTIIKDKLRIASKEFNVSEQMALAQDSFTKFNESKENRAGLFVEYSQHFSTFVRALKSKQTQDDEKALKVVETIYSSVKNVFNTLLGYCTDNKMEILKMMPETCNRIAKLVTPHESQLVVNLPDQEYISSLFDYKAEYRLLFRASGHNFQASSFHQVCDGKGPTLTIVKANNKVFGGFIDQAWSSNGTYQSSNNTFLFSLDRKLQFKIKVPANAGYNAPGNGPVFGSGHDLCLTNSCNQSSSSTTNLGVTYEVPNELAAEAKNLLAGSNSFQVTDYEVFQVLK